MPLILILTALGLTLFRSDIKTLDSYALTIQNPTISYELEAQDSASNSFNQLKYIPHISSFTGITIATKQVEFGISFQNNDEDKEFAQESKLLDLQLMGTFNKHLWQVYYQNYQGLYITDSSVENSNQPRANSYAWGGEMTHFTRNGYIVDRSLGNFMLEKETNWSALFNLSFSKARLSSERGLIPDQFKNNFNQLAGLTAFETQNLGLGTGITGMYTYAGIHLSALVGLGMIYQEQFFSGIDQSRRTLTTQYTQIISDIGFTGKKNSFGLQLRVRNYTIPVKNATYSQTNGLSMFYYKYFF